jgi:2-oxoglutarate dehydrogenase E2 component (dihydrolipoamide succinyltransferase)
VDPELSAFEQRKENARAMFDLNRVPDVAFPGVGVAVVGEHDHHYATSMSPRGWFMPNSQTWSKYSQTGGDQDSPPEAPPPIRIPDFELRIINPDPPPEVVSFVTDASKLAIRNLVNVDPPLQLPEEEVNRFKTVPRVGESMVLKPRVTENLRPTFGAAGFNRSLNLNALVNAGQSITLTPRGQNFRRPVITSPGLLDLRPQAGPDFPQLVDSPDLSRLRSMITSETLQKMIGATTPQEVKTEGFTVTFDYTIVTFERPWWDEVFLAVPGWRVPGFTPGQLATGAVARTASQFITLITCGMVVIRNLEIRAAWEGSDLESAPSAASLGPFCIAGAEWNEQALRRPGLQAIAWLCQVPPVIPPN